MLKNKKGRPKSFKNKRYMTISIEESFYKHLEQQAIIMSAREDRVIKVSEIVRRGLEAAFPTKKQMMLDL